MMFCWYCGKVFKKTYIKTHLGNHVTKEEITLDECRQYGTNYAATSRHAVVSPWCGEQYEEWRFKHKVLTSTRKREVENTSD